MDCEGCEYDDIILHAPSEVLNRLNHIQIEYHYGYRNLKDKLENVDLEFLQPNQSVSDQ